MKLANGIIAMLVTPFHGDYQLNEDALRREVRWSLDHGAEGVVAAPSIGEFLHLSEAERTRVFEVIVDEARRRQNICAVAMTSG
ncbi:MAG TPA: dihydrodipicolinate synthase family protein, partial [Candidatus Binataceae bacterium]|nr:dihydrodipicolinate synthase family protein [Candidatus Binataceae bacterium]